MKLFAVVAFVIPSIGLCAPTRIPPPQDKVDRIASTVVTPDVGVVTEVEIGAALYKQSRQVTTTYHQASIPQAVAIDLERGYRLAVPAGSARQIKLRSFGKAPMICLPTTSSGVVGFFGDRNVAGCLVDRKSSGSFDAATLPEYEVYFPLKEEVKYTVTEVKDTVEDTVGFRFEILYQGLSRGEVKIAYREYIKQLARPSFNQDLTFELDKSGQGVIAFKGMRIKVLEATGSSIRYVLDRAVPAENPAPDA